MNGVMQICDNEKGLNDIFKINEEVVSYSTYDEIIEKINYYLGFNAQRSYDFLVANAWQTADSVYLNKQYGNKLIYIISISEKI